MGDPREHIWGLDDRPLCSSPFAELHASKLNPNICARCLAVFRSRSRRRVERWIAQGALEISAYLLSLDLEERSRQLEVILKALDIKTRANMEGAR